MQRFATLHPPYRAFPPYISTFAAGPKARGFFFAGGITQRPCELFRPQHRSELASAHEAVGGRPVLFEPLVLGAAAAACAAGQKQAGEAKPGQAAHFQVAAELTLVSDYRRGGATRSDGDPALQGRIDVRHDSGWSAGAFASSIHGRQGSNAEVALFGARKLEFGETDLSLGASAVIFLGGDADPFGVAQASVSHPVGPVDATLAVNYAWPQQALDDEYGLAINLRVRSPIGRVFGAPLTVAVSFGRAEGEFAMGADVKLDWSAGVTTEISGTEFGLSYVDNDLDDERGEGGWVFSITHEF